MEKCIQSIKCDHKGLHTLEVSGEHMYLYTYSKKKLKWGENGNCADVSNTYKNIYKIGIWSISRIDDYMLLCRDGTHHYEIIFDYVIHNNYIYTCEFTTVICKWDKNNHLSVNSMNGHENRVTCLASHDGFLYSGSLDSSIRKWNDKDECIKIIQSKYLGPLTKLVSHNEFLYSKSYIDLYKGSKIQKWKNEQCIQIIECPLSIYSSVVYSGHLYTGCIDGSILKWGEYWPHHYSLLPVYQKHKLKIWRTIWKQINIHKDIAFLFDREILC